MTWLRILVNTLRRIAAPHWCSRGRHRWQFSRGVRDHYVCQDCAKYIPVRRYSST